MPPHKALRSAPLAPPVTATAPEDSGSVAPPLDSEGRYVDWAPRSWGVVGLYIALILLILLLIQGPGYDSPYLSLLLAAVLAVYLIRYLTTHYVMDAETLSARRLFGSRTVRLETIRSVELANLRELGTMGMFGTWGWRSRVYSTFVGSFDSIHTVSPGVLISSGNVPMFLSPHDPVAFARELSRRARSWGVDLPPIPLPVSARSRNY